MCLHIFMNKRRRRAKRGDVQSHLFQNNPRHEIKYALVESR
jgi:hypothetical protein